jgi:hypothetical protein
MKSYKTTISGCLIAVFVAVQPIIETGILDWKKIGIAALIAAFSFFAKDNNVTGGTKPQ